MKLCWSFVMALAVILSAAAGEPTVLKPGFKGGRISNYQGNTAIDTKGGEVDFTVSCTRTGACETAWGVFSRPMPVAKEAAAYVFEFEIRADKDWINPETSGESWDNAINWLDADGQRI